MTHLPDADAHPDRTTGSTGGIAGLSPAHRPSWYIDDDGTEMSPRLLAAEAKVTAVRSWVDQGEPYGGHGEWGVGWEAGYRSAQADVERMLEETKP